MPQAGGFKLVQPTITTVALTAIIPIGLFAIADISADRSHASTLIFVVSMLALSIGIVRLLIDLSHSTAQLAFASTLSITFLGAPFLWATALTALSSEGQCLSNVKTKFDILYFAYITATTTGYGDIAPLGVCRIVSVLNALTSLLGIGILVSLATRESQGKNT